MQGRLSHRDVQRVLAHYDVGDAYGVTADGGGTANANFLVRTPARTLFLRRRNPRYTAPDMLEFDHRLQQHLACAGLCTPLAIPTRDGNTWLRLDDSVYELYPYVEGHCHDRQNVAQVADAARHLARFHAATAGFDTRGQKRWPRYDSPSLIREALREAWGLASSDEQRARIGWLCEQTERLANALPDALYASLPACVIHGDYHPANLKFRGDEVVGIFDLDWATLQPCARDLADGLLFFAARRRTDIDDRDIASLTQAPQIDIERSLVFVDAYLQCGSIENAEIAALPEFMRARWLYCRAAGMAKVEPPRRVAFLLNEIEGPLRWLDEHKEEFTSQLSRLARSRA